MCSLSPPLPLASPLYSCVGARYGTQAIWLETFEAIERDAFGFVTPTRKEDGNSQFFLAKYKIYGIVSKVTSLAYALHLAECH